MLSLYDSARLSVIACDVIAVLLTVYFCFFYFYVVCIELSVCTV